ncbi:MAG: hypothetical protein ACTSYO_01765 [Candidatus Ranarchaeia archaeon]
MGSKVTVSAKIDTELRKKLAEFGIKPSDIIKKALKEEIEKHIQQELMEKVSEASNIISRINRDDWVKLVRQNRDEQ